MFGWLKRLKRSSVLRPTRTLPIDPALFEQRGHEPIRGSQHPMGFVRPEDLYASCYEHGCRSVGEAIFASTAGRFPGLSDLCRAKHRVHGRLRHPVVGAERDQTILDACPDGPPRQINPVIEQRYRPGLGGSW